jgi:hypothetical protein
MSTPPRRPPPAWLRRWEGLHIVVQVAIVAPLAILLLWWIHVALLAQPLGRGFAYGVFWGLLATAFIVGASRSEKARRDRPPPGGRLPPGGGRG